MALGININSREFWTNYVRTSHFEAGKALGLEPNAQSLQNAQNARQIREEYRPVINNYSINYSPWNIDWSSRIVNVASAPVQSAQERREQREEDNASQAACIGTIVTLAASFIFARTYKNYMAKQETLALTQNIRGQIPQWEQHNDPILRDIYILTTHQLAIDTLNAASIQKYAIAALALLAGGALMAIGGFAAISALITLGKITTLAAIVFGVFSIGWHWDDETILTRHYTNIAGVSGISLPNIGLANRILENLPRVFDENMHRLAQPMQTPPRYESLYPGLYVPCPYQAVEVALAAASASAPPADLPPPYAQTSGS